MLRLAAPIAILMLSAGAATAQTAEMAQAGAKAADAIILTGPVGALFVLVVIGLVLACGVLGFVIRALWNTIAGRDTIIAGLQDKRADDAAKSSKLLAEVATTGSAALAANTTSQAELTNRMQSFVDLLRPLGPDQARIMASLDRNADKIDECGKAVGESAAAVTRALGDCTAAVARIRGAA